MHKLPYILLVEDDPSIILTLTHALRNDFKIDPVQTGKLAIYKCDVNEYDLIVLNLGLPDLNGLQVCQQLRERGVTTRIMILSGETRTIAKINLLDAGANDYVSKPFSLGELKARMRVLLRNMPKPPLPRQIMAGDLLLDRKTRTVSRGGARVRLRRKEFAMLECLMEHAGSVVTRDILVNRAWDYDTHVWTNTIDVHIKHLRDKIDRPFGKTTIRTVHGLGYKLEIIPQKMPATSVM